ncbi:MAG: DTW domain-containing protein [Proteobacteria bacterium]|nr:DTW domain-containing protein [Pseudomonadota bacterium]
MTRVSCPNCARIQTLCLCSRITPFEIDPMMILLVHPREYSKTTGTARIVARSIRDCRIFRGYGQDFDQDPRLLVLLQDPTLRVVILYPGPKSVNLTETSEEGLLEALPRDGRRLCILLVDGTWSSAKRMIRTSRVLSELPRVSFSVEAPSRFRFKKQPNAVCLSTVEATSLLIETLARRGLCSVTPPGAHWKMIEAFETLVDTQLGFLPSAKD